MTQSTSTNMAEIYRFLAQSMRYPSPDWMQADYFSALNTFLVELGWDAEAQSIRQAIVEGADWLEPLQVEHTRLFVNAVPSVVAPPYGSIYLSADGMLYGPSAEKAKAFYREQGFDLAGEADIPDSLPRKARAGKKSFFCKSISDHGFQNFKHGFYKRVVTLFMEF